MHPADVYHSKRYLTLDMETTNLLYGNACHPDNRLLLSCWKTSQASLPSARWAGVFHNQDLVQACERADFLICHNAKMELKWLHRAGADLSKIMVWDTMLAEYVLLGNRKADLSLDATAQRYGCGHKERYVQGALDSGICPAEMPQNFVLRRCAGDVQLTEAVFLKQLPLLQKAGLLPVMYTRCAATPMLAEMEMQGLALDKEKVTALWKKYNSELNTVTHELHAFTGGVNPNSPKQMVEYLYNQLKFKPLRARGKDVLSADADTLAKLVPTTAEQAKFLELKRKQAGLHAACSKALNKFKDCIDADKLLFGQFNQAVTATHRLSSNGVEFGVQFQNMDRDFKPLIVPRRPGWLIGEADGAQIEFRVAAFLGQDYTAWKSIKDGEDVHAFTAETLTAAGQKTDRQTAKSHTFKPLYGGQSGTKAERAYYAAFREKYPGIAAAQLRWQHEVLRNQRLRLASGLYLYFPGTVVSSDGYIQNSTQICNYPVQSLATGEITMIAAVALWRRMKAAQMQGFLVNTVHDSVVSEIPEHEAELFRELAVKAFTEDVYKYLEEVYDMRFNIPLGVGFKCGPAWGVGDEVKLQVDPPYAPPAA